MQRSNDHLSSLIVCSTGMTRPMRNALKSLMFVTLILLGPGLAMVSAADAPGGADSGAPLPGVTQNDLQALQQRLDGLKQQISSANNYNQLEGPQDRVQAFI